MSDIVADCVWDAGDMGCGELLIALRGRLRTMPRGVIKVISLDLGAPEDLPAWCRLTGNALLRHDRHERAFWIRSRDTW